MSDALPTLAAVTVLVDRFSGTLRSYCEGNHSADELMESRAALTDAIELLHSAAEKGREDSALLDRLSGVTLNGKETNVTWRTLALMSAAAEQERGSPAAATTEES